MIHRFASRILAAVVPVLSLSLGVSLAQTAAYVDGIDPSCGGNSPCYPTIQAAVNGEPDGATIVVRPGTYREDYFADPTSNHDPSLADIHGLWIYKNFQTITSIDGSATDGSANTIIDCPEPWIPYGGVRISGNGNTFQGFKVVDNTISAVAGHDHPHYLIKVEGDNNSVFNNTLVGRGTGFNSDRGILVQGETFSSGGGDGLSFFTNIKRNEIYGSCYGIDIADDEPARIQDDAGIQCNYIHDNCKAISVRIDCDLISPLGETVLRPLRYNHIANSQFGGLQVEYRGSCDPLIDAIDNYWNDPSGPNVSNTGMPGVGDTIIGVPELRSNVKYDPWLTAAIVGECPPQNDALIGDFVWSDTNANGIQDDGEPGIANVVVNLYGCDGSVVRSTITAGDGSYSFTVPPGDYYVEVVPPAGYLFGPKDSGANDAADSDADPSTGRMACTTLIAQEKDRSWDAGLYKPATIGNFVWNDANANGIQSGSEPGFPNLLVSLYRCDGTSVGSVYTDANGSYSFGVAPGSYYVQFTAPGGYAFSSADQGANDETDSDANVTTGRTICTILESGESDLSWDAGVYQITSSLGNFVWNDTDRDGIQEAGEPGIGGVTVNLLRCDNSPVASTTTDGAGYYIFNALVPGCYVVEFVKPAGYDFSPANQGANDQLDSDANANSGRTQQINLGAGVSDLSWDAGLNRPAPCPPVSNASNFNGTKINAGRTIWFNAVLKPSGLGSGPVTIRFTNQTITFAANGTNFNLAVPDSEITFTSAVSSATTTFDTVGNKWVTQVPLSFDKNVFLSGLAFPVSAQLPGGINPVTWSGSFSTSKPGVTLSWKWAAAVYTQFTTNSNAIGVKPVDGDKLNPYKNSDHAGTPENYKGYVTGGARGGGGSNFTGSYSGTKSVTPCGPN